MPRTPPGADFAAIVRTHPDSILVVSDNGKILFANTAGMRLLCRLPDGFGYLPAPLDVPGGHSTSISLHDLAGREIHLTMDAHYIEWCDLQARALYIRDITAQVHEQRTMHELIYRDHLTGLYNRRGLERIAHDLLVKAAEEDGRFVMLYIDINGLKQVNDNQSHRMGDALIQETAALLSEVFGEEAIKARIGGDEFVVLVNDRLFTPVEEAIELLRFTAEACNQIPGRHYELSLSIGLADHHGERPADIAVLVDQAERRMYQAKQAGADACVRCLMLEPPERHGRTNGTSASTSQREAAR